MQKPNFKYPHIILRKGIYFWIFLIICFSVMYLSISKAQNILLDLEIDRTNITVKQGVTSFTVVKMTNLRDEIVMLVTYKFDAPTGMNISAVPPDYFEIMPNVTNPMFLYITPSETLENGTYKIKIWAEAQETIDGKKIMSDKYPIDVKVFINPTIPTTITTTTITTTTTTTTTTLNETTTTTLAPGSVERIFWKKEYTIILVICVVFLVALPFLSFRSAGEPEKITLEE